jgi:hypothetical protein
MMRLDNAVIHALASQFPGLSDADAELRDVFWLGREDDQDCELAAFALFKQTKLFFQRGGLLGGQGVGEVCNARRERWDCDLGSGV